MHRTGRWVSVTELLGTYPDSKRASAVPEARVPRRGSFVRHGTEHPVGDDIPVAIIARPLVHHQETHLYIGHTRPELLGVITPAKIFGLCRVVYLPSILFISLFIYS